MVRYTYTPKSASTILTSTEWNTLAEAMADDSIAPGYVVAASDSPDWMKDAAHFVCDGTGDEVEWQAAIDACQTHVMGGVNAIPDVYIMPGNYYWANQVVRKSASLIGVMPNLGVRVFWTGATGAGTYALLAQYLNPGTGTPWPGNNSFGIVSGINFRGGYPDRDANAPFCWLDLRERAVDNFFRLENIHFGTCTGPAIDMIKFLNALWRDLRWDYFGTYCIRCTPEVGSTLGVLRIHGFTVDSRKATAEGIIHIDNTTANGSNLGTVKLADGRIEINENGWTGGKGIFTLTTPDPGNTRAVGFHLDNVTFQDLTAVTGDCVVYSNTTATSVTISLILENFRQSGLTATLAGTLLSGHSNPTLKANNGLVVIGQGGSTDHAMAVDRVLIDKGLFVGYAAANATAPTWTNRLQVFDATGTSLGYIKISSA